MTTLAGTRDFRILFSDFAENFTSFGELFVDPFIQKGPDPIDLSVEDIEEIVRSVVQPYLTAGVLGVVTPAYLLLSTVPGLITGDPETTERGYDVPWQPFEYTRLALQLVEPMTELAVSTVVSGFLDVTA